MLPARYQPDLSIRTEPYTFEDQLQDSLNMNSFSTSDTGQPCYDQVFGAVLNGSRKFIINLQDNNLAEFRTALNYFSSRRKEFYIELRFDLNYFQQHNPADFQSHLLNIIQTLNLGIIDRLTFPKGIKQVADSISHNLISMSYVKQAILY
jgi:hypothetical protein